MENLIYKEEAYQIIGKCMEVHNNLGAGFLEIVYKDALQLEFKRAGIPFQREVQYKVNYKGIILPHHFYADFVVFDKIILEIKALSKGFADAHSAHARINNTTNARINNNATNARIKCHECTNKNK